MPSVTIHEDGFPSQIEGDAAPEDPNPIRPVSPGVDSVVDDKGRVLVVRTIGPRERMRLFKAIGPVNSRNEPYVGTATLAYSVSKIDEDPVPAPANEVQLEVLVDRLGDEGINAVARVMMHRMGITEADLISANGDPAIAAQLAMERRNKETMAAAKN